MGQDPGPISKGTDRLPGIRPLIKHDYQLNNYNI